MSKKVNKEKVARDAEMPLSGPRLQLAMVGNYLLAKERHNHFTTLLDSKTE